MPQDPTLTHPSWFVDKAASSYIKEDDSEGLSKNANPETVSLAMFGYRIRADVTKDIQMGDIHEFEEVLFLLRKRDPERWSVKERLKVISYLADFVMETNQFEAFVRPRDDDDVVDGEVRSCEERSDELGIQYFWLQFSCADSFSVNIDVVFIATLF